MLAVTVALASSRRPSGYSHLRSRLVSRPRLVQGPKLPHIWLVFPPSWTQDTQQERDGSFHGVRFLSAYSTQAIVVLVYLANTVRPQGFSPSRRFDPAWASQVCFTPHPPTGFDLQSFSHSGSRTPLGAVALVPLSQPRFSRLPESPLGPCPPTSAVDQRPDEANLRGVQPIHLMTDATSASSSQSKLRKNKKSGRVHREALEQCPAAVPFRLVSNRDSCFGRAWASTSEPCSARASVLHRLR
jgi:hypothetical protein